MSGTPRTPAGFPVHAFAGTAEHYLRFRLPYPGELFEDLLARAGPIEGQLLDLGCASGSATPSGASPGRASSQ